MVAASRPRRRCGAGRAVRALRRGTKRCAASAARLRRGDDARHRSHAARRSAQRTLGRTKDMCGIAGIVDTRGRRDIDGALLSRMNEAQHHRGPDECGMHVEPGVGLAHRRLSIIDVATGQQPLWNEDRSVVIVYNGEIYNYRELIPELARLGHRFRTRSDTEVVVHAW